MPKVRLNRNYESAQELKRRINAAIAYKGMTKEETAEKSGMSYATFKRRISDPREFTLAELKRVIAVTGVDPVYILEVLK